MALEQGPADHPSLLVTSCTVGLPALLCMYSAILALKPSRLQLFSLHSVVQPALALGEYIFSGVEWLMAARIAAIMSPTYLSNAGFVFGH